MEFANIYGKVGPSGTWTQELFKSHQAFMLLIPPHPHPHPAPRPLSFKMRADTMQFLNNYLYKKLYY